jgi:hypothetical protein
MRVLLLILLFALNSCAKKKPAKHTDSLFEPQQSVGAVGKKLREASGLVASKSNPGYLWTLNDGGNPSNIYLLNGKAEIAMTVVLKNIVNRDWEEIFIGPGPKADVNYIYVAEIGDNNAIYEYKLLYRLEEPTLSKESLEVDQIDTLVFNLPGGPRDTETMMVDPLTQHFYIISKREQSVRFYQIDFPFASDTLSVKEITTLPFDRIVAANISSDGNEILMKNYKHIYYWKRLGNESVVEALKRAPLLLNYSPEPQGESIAWNLDGSGFYTLSESENGSGGTLYFYKRK